MDKYPGEGTTLKGVNKQGWTIGDIELIAEYVIAYATYVRYEQKSWEHNKDQSAYSIDELGNMLLEENIPRNEIEAAFAYIRRYEPFGAEVYERECIFVYGHKPKEFGSYEEWLTDVNTRMEDIDKKTERYFWESLGFEIKEDTNE